MNERGTEVLLVSDDEAVIVETGRLAAAAGVVPRLVREPGAALVAWTTAQTVLIGADQVGPMASLSPPPRPHVLVVSVGPAADAVFRDALGAGAGAIVELPDAGSALIDLLTDAADGAADSGVVVGVVGGAGGVGATTFAAALAHSFGQHGRVLLVDADRWGAGIDTVLGLESAEGARWDGLAHGAGRLSARSLRETLPRSAGTSLITWSADRDPPLLSTVRSVVSAGRRGYPLIVVDLPRPLDAIGQELLTRCDHVVLVATVTVPALAAGVQVARRLHPERSGVLLRGRGGVREVDAARLLGLRVLHRMPDQRGLDEAISLGLGPLRSQRGALARAVRAVTAELGLGDVR